jgi:hypothetical protein
MEMRMMLEERVSLPLDDVSPTRTFIQRNETSLSDTPTLRGDETPHLESLPTLSLKIPERARTLSAPPSFTSKEAWDVLPVPEELNEAATRRMAWIMTQAMDTILPALQPEQRSLIEGITDVRQLLVPLFQSWEEFRSGDNRKIEAAKTAKAMYKTEKKPYKSNQLFERFWSRKVVAEQDETSWRGFKTVVKGLLEQMSLIQNILDASMASSVRDLQDCS